MQDLVFITYTRHLSKNMPDKCIINLIIHILHSMEFVAVQFLQFSSFLQSYLCEAHEQAKVLASYFRVVLEEPFGTDVSFF